MFSTSSKPEIHHPAAPWPLNTHLHSCSHFVGPLRGKAWNLGLSGASPVTALRGPFKSHYKPNETQLMKHRCPIGLELWLPVKRPVKINERSLVAMEMGSSRVNPFPSPIYEFITISNFRASESTVASGSVISWKVKTDWTWTSLASPLCSEHWESICCLSAAQAPGYFLLSWWLRWWRICLQCRRPGFNPWVGEIPWRKEWLPTPVFLPGGFHRQRSLGDYSPWGRKESDMNEKLTLGFPCGSASKESTCNVEDLGSIPGLGRPPGEGKNYPFQYSGLENPMDCIVHEVTMSQTWLSNFHFLNWWDESTALCPPGTWKQAFHGLTSMSIENNTQELDQSDLIAKSSPSWHWLCLVFISPVD